MGLGDRGCSFHDAEKIDKSIRSSFLLCVIFGEVLQSTNHRNILAEIQELACRTLYRFFNCSNTRYAEQSASIGESWLTRCVINLFCGGIKILVLLLCNILILAIPINNPSCYLEMTFNENPRVSLTVGVSRPPKQRKTHGYPKIVVFCLCNEMLKSLHHYEDTQCQMTDAEVMTTAIVAIFYFQGNFCLASRYLVEYHYIPNMLSKSRFNRRLHRMADLFLTWFLRLGEIWEKLNEKSVYVIDSYPIAVCDNYRIRRSKIYRGEEWRGYIASKKRYFYSLRIHVMVTEQGEPVEFF